MTTGGGTETTSEMPEDSESLAISENEDAELLDGFTQDNETDGEEAAEDTQNAESTISTQELQESLYSVSAQSEEFLVVPEDGLYIKETGACSGIKLEWFNAHKNDGKLFKVVIPASVTSIESNAFSANNPLLDYSGALIGAVDFSKATALTKIGASAFEYQKNLTGELNLANTKVASIGGSAFFRAGLTGVVLPSTLSSLGTSGNGATFGECGSLQYVRTADSSSNVTFELPSALTYIGSFTFRYSFANPVYLKLPATVETIGQEAFNSDKIEIVIEHGDGFDGYSPRAFWGTGLVVLKNEATYNTVYNKSDEDDKARKNLAYPIDLRFSGKNITQKKLNHQSIQYELDSNTGFWKLNTGYTLPEIAGGGSEGVIAKWKLNDAELTNTTTLNATGNAATATSEVTLADPTVTYTQNDVEQESNEIAVTLTKGTPQTIGVKVNHPLLGKVLQSGESVRVFYHWEDKKSGTASGYGPRQSELTAKGSVNAIPVTSLEDSRTDSDFYSVTVKVEYKTGGQTYSCEKTFLLYVSVKKLTVGYNLDDGTASDASAYQDVLVEKGESLTLAKAPTKAGYLFTGWSDGTKTYVVGQSVTITEDTTFTALWQTADEWIMDHTDNEEKLEVDVSVIKDVSGQSDADFDVDAESKEAIAKYIHDLLNTTAKGEVPAGMTADEAQDLRDLLNTGAPDIDVNVTIEADLQQTPTADELQTLLGSSYSPEETAQQWELSVVLTAVAKNATGGELDTVNRVALSETAPITIVLTTGQDLTGKDVRVLYNHDNAVGTAPSQVLDAAEGKVAVTASKFSPYVVLSKAKPAAPVDNGSSNDQSQSTTGTNTATTAAAAAEAQPAAAPAEAAEVKAQTVTIPRTGDDFSPAAVTVIALAALLGFAVTVTLKKRKN